MADNDLKLVPDKSEFNQWKKNLMLFLAPVGIIYFTAVVGLVQTADHVFSFNDFVPNSFQLGAIVLYLLNTTLDYLRKVRAS